jgi:hypothetical protein
VQACASGFEPLRFDLHRRGLVGESKGGCGADQSGYLGRLDGGCMRNDGEWWLRSRRGEEEDDGWMSN